MRDADDDTRVSDTEHSYSHFQYIPIYPPTSKRPIWHTSIYMLSRVIEQPNEESAFLYSERERERDRSEQ